MKNQNLVEKGILNNVESHLQQIKTCTNVSEAKAATIEMIHALNIKQEHKNKLLNGLAGKRDLTSVMMFAYNINLKGEGLGTN